MGAQLRQDSLSSEILSRGSSTWGSASVEHHDREIETGKIMFVVFEDCFEVALTGQVLREGAIPADEVD